MKKIIITLFIGLIVGAVAISLFTAIYKDGKEGVGGAFKLPSYNTASSTVYTIGDDLSTKVMDQHGGRTYAIICNNTSGNNAYILFGSTVVTGTTTANVELSAGECYEITREIGYTGEVQVISETSTTTDSLLVTEFIGF